MTDPSASLYFVHDVPDPASAGSATSWQRAVATGRRLYRDALLALVCGQARREDEVIVVANGDMHEHLAERLPSHVRLIRSDDRLRHYFQSFGDEQPMVRPVLDFVDALHDRAPAASGVDAAFGQPLRDLRMLELRWLVPMTFRLGFAPLLDDLLRHHRVRRIRVFGLPQELPILRRGAASSGHSLAAWTRPAAWLVDRLIQRKEGNFARRIPAVLFPRDAVPPRPAHVATASRRLLAVCNYDRTTERLIRMLPALRAQGWDVHAVALRRVRAVDRLRQAGVKVWPAESLLEPADHDAARAGGDAARTAVAALRGGLPVLDQQVFGVSVRAAAMPFLAGLVPGAIIASRLAQIVATRLLDIVRPAVTLHFEDWEMNRALTFIGRARGVPSLAYYCLSGVPRDTIFRRTQDWFAASGANLARGFGGQFAPNQVRIVGDVLAEVPGTGAAASRADLRARLNLPQDRRVIVLLATFPGQSSIALAEIQRVFQRTFAAARGLGDTIVAVKAHPAQSLVALRSWMADWGCEGPVFQSESLADVVGAADLVSTVITSAVFQAMACEVPVVCLQSRGSIQPFEFAGFDFLQEKGVVHVGEEAEAVPIIRRLLDDEAVRAAQIARGLSHVVEHLGPQDGRAVERMVALLDEVADSAAEPIRMQRQA